MGFSVEEEDENVSEQNNSENEEEEEEIEEKKHPLKLHRRYEIRSPVVMAYYSILWYRLLKFLEFNFSFEQRHTAPPEE